MFACVSNYVCDNTTVCMGKYDLPKQLYVLENTNNCMYWKIQTTVCIGKYKQLYVLENTDYCMYWKIQTTVCIGKCDLLGL